MALTLLQIVNNAQNELGLPASTTVAGNTDATTVQMLALTNRCLNEMRRMNPTGWSNCMVEWNVQVTTATNSTGNIGINATTITNVPAGVVSAITTPSQWAISGANLPQACRVLAASGTTITLTMESTNATVLVASSITLCQDTYALPTDYDWTQNRTHWDRTNRWELLGPDSPQMDQWHKSGIVVTGPRRHFRRQNAGSNSITPNIETFTPNQWRLWPPPTEISSPLQLAFEYLSTNAVNVSGGNTTYAEYFVNDTDQPVLDGNALVMGLKWMFWRTKGFNVDDWKNDWIDYVNTLISRDEGAGTLSLVKRVHPIFISPANVQDGFFAGPTGPNMG